MELLKDKRVLFTIATYIVVILAALTINVKAQAPTVLNIGQILALSILAFICGLDYIWVTPTGIWRPTIVGTIAGIIVGRPELGLVAGSLIEFTFLGLFTIGGGTVPEAASGTIVAVILGAITGTSVADAATLVPIAWPVAALTMNIEIMVRAGDAFFTHWADAEIEKGNFDKIGMINILGAIPWALSRTIPVFIFGLLGGSPEAAASINAAITNPMVQPIWNAMTVAGCLMPALGVALMVRAFYRPVLLPFFLFGFALAAYFNINLIGIAMVLVAFVVGIYLVEWRIRFGELKFEAAGEKKERVLTKGDLNKAFWLSWFIQSSWNYERMMGTGYAHGMLHIEKKLRKDPEELKDWMRMHSEFYNTEPHLHNIILGMDIALEEQGNDMETVRALKTALMGPFAGLGDSVMWFTLLPIAFAIGADLGSRGNFLGPVIAFLIWVPISWLVKYYSTIFGYNYGEGVATVLKGDVLKFVREVIAAFALGMMGAIGALYVNAKTGLEYKVYVPETGQWATVFNLQNILDMVMPRLLSLIFIVYTYWLLKKGLSLSKTVIVLFITGIVLALVGVLVPP